MMKTFSIPIYRPAKFGASAADIAVVTNELHQRISQRLESFKGQELLHSHHILSDTDPLEE